MKNADSRSVSGATSAALPRGKRWGQGRAGILVSQVPREQTVRVGFSVICGYSVTPEKQALGLLKKEVLSILKTIPLCNSTSVETLKGQIV